MADCFIFDNGGTVSIGYHVDTSIPLDDVARRAVPPGTPFHLIARADIPQDRTFRAAWVLDQKKISVDIVKARVVTAARLSASSVDASRRASIQAQINAATTVDQMRSLIDKESL